MGAAEGKSHVRVDGDYDYVDRATRQRRVMALEQDEVHSESVSVMKHNLRQRRGNLLESCHCSLDAADPYARSVVLGAMEMAETVSQEADTLDSRWLGYHRRPLQALLHGDDQGGNLGSMLILLATKVEELVELEPTLVQAPVPTRIFGDLHGQFRDLLLWLQDFGFPHDYGPAYVFNGDWVDRGAHQVETVALIFALKVTFPKKVFLVRGNHEFRDINIHSGERGFKAACNAIGPDGQKVFEAFQAAFDSLPLGCVVGEKVLVVHGGIGDGNWDLDELSETERPITVEDAAANPLVYNVLWSDPIPESNEASFGVHSSPRDGHQNMTKRFGKDVTEAFCERNGLEMIVRSHQEKIGGCGYEVMHGNRLMRVFSARDYEGHNNDGAMLKVRSSKGGKLIIRAQLLRSITKVRDEHEANFRVADAPMFHAPICSNGPFNCLSGESNGYDSIQRFEDVRGYDDEGYEPRQLPH